MVPSTWKNPAIPQGALGQAHFKMDDSKFMFKGKNIIKAKKPRMTSLTC